MKKNQKDNESNVATKKQKIDKNLAFVRLVTFIFTVFLIGALIQKGLPYFSLMIKRSDKSALMTFFFTISALFLTSYQIIQTARNSVETGNKETIDGLKKEYENQIKWVSDRIDAIEEAINKRFDSIEARNSYIEGVFQDISIRQRTHEDKPGHAGVTEQISEIITKIAELKALINTEPKINILINKLDRMQMKLMSLTNKDKFEDEDEDN